MAHSLFASTLLAAACLLLSWIPGGLGAENAAKAGDYAAVLRREVMRFPLLQFGKDGGTARLHSIDAAKDGLRQGNVSFQGFRFRAPEWLDGGVDLVVFPSAEAAPELEGVAWTLLPVAEGPASTVDFAVREAKDYPRFAAQHPQDSHFLSAKIPQTNLKQGGEYLLFRTSEKTTGLPLRVAMAIDSIRGKFELGPLPTVKTPQPFLRSSKEVMADVMKLRGEQGDEAALGLLETEFARRVELNADIRELFLDVWGEAQVGTGREFTQWAAKLNDRMFTLCSHHRFYYEAMEIAPNTLVSLNGAQRHGRWAEVLAWWSEGQRAGGYQLDPAAYPDLGPALKDLPEVRRREIPMLLAFSKPEFTGAHPRSLPNTFTHLDLAGFLSYSRQAARSGRWKEALEWKLWVMEMPHRIDPKDKQDRVTEMWYQAGSEVARTLSTLELEESALQWYVGQVDSNLPTGYAGRAKLSARINMIDTRLRLKAAEPDVVKQMADLVSQVRKNPYLTASEWAGAELVHARAMMASGLEDEGMALIAKLLGEGHEEARGERVRYWVENGHVEGVESEFLKILESLRKTGNKLGEAEWYGLYADFLEKTGRHSEALRMRRETLRLCRAFDLFVALPRNLAKLAVLLASFGDQRGANAAREEAGMLLEDGRIPARVSQQILQILAGFTGRPSAAQKKSTTEPAVDLQPVRSIVVPVAGTEWATIVTLANPSDQVVEGTLAATGVPLTLATDGDGDIIAAIGAPAVPSKAELQVHLESGTYKVIRVQGRPAIAATGTLKLSWTSAVSTSQAHSEIILEPAETGVATSIIEAGEFRHNAFYGVPIHHHYVDATHAGASQPMRFMASCPARIELYDADDAPMSVDADGNGSLLDPGDVLFTHSDGKGNVIMPLRKGLCAFKLVIYPSQALTGESITIRTETFVNGGWTLYAEDRLIP